LPTETSKKGRKYKQKMGIAQQKTQIHVERMKEVEGGGEKTGFSQG